MRMRRMMTGRRMGLEIEDQITIRRPVEQVYSFLRDLENLPRVMRHLESVTSLGDGRHHWVATTSGRRPITLEWDTAILNERPNELITWRSFSGSDVDNAGNVRFHELPSGQGTEVQVSLHYLPVGGMMGMAWGRLFGAALKQEVHEDLQRFKLALERGEPIAIQWRAGREPRAVRTTPSQAEGDRTTIEEDLCEKGLATEQECWDAARRERAERQPIPVELPSQAEGDRATIEDDLRRRGLGRRRR